MNQQEQGELLDTVREIKRALIGSEEFGEDGLIKDVKSLKKWRYAVTLKVAFWSGAASTVVVVANRLIDYVIAHK